MNNLKTNNLSCANNPDFCRDSCIHRAFLISAYLEQELLEP